MGYFTSAERRGRIENPRVPLSAATVGDLWGDVHETDAGIAVSEESALRATAVFSAIRIIAESIASLPFGMYERIERGRRSAPSHPLHRLLHDEMNPEMSAMTGREVMAAHLAGWGGAYLEKQFDGAGRIIALWPLLPDRTKAVRVNQVKWIQTRLPSGSQALLPAERVLHVPGLGFDGLNGYSPIGLARQAIGLALATERFGARHFGNGAKMSGVLRHPKILNEKGQANLRDSFERLYTGLSNSHRVAILEEGMEWQQIGIAPEESQFLETRKFQVTEIARIFRVPPHMLADLDRATFSNIEHLSIEFVVHTLRPWLVRIEQAINMQLLTRDERDRFFARHTVDGLLRGDIKTRFEAYGQALMNGWYSPNDIREFEDKNPIEGGDRYFVQQNMMPLDMVDTVVTSKSSAPTPRSFERLFREIADSAVRKECDAIRRAMKKAQGGRDGVRLRTELDEFYESFDGWVSDRFSAAIEAAGVDGSLVSGWVSDSRAAVAAIIARVDPSEVEGAIDAELVKWEGERAARVARELVTSERRAA